MLRVVVDADVGGDQSAAPFCTSRRSRNALQRFTRATYTENYRKNAAPQNEPRTRTHTLCEPAQLKCTSTFHKSHGYTETYRKNAAAQLEHPDQAPAFTPTVRTLLCGHTVRGKTDMLQLSQARDSFCFPATSREARPKCFIVPSSSFMLLTKRKN